MPATNNRPQHEPDHFAPDTRPGGDQFVYCKGCGTRLESRTRLQKPKAVVDTMMCPECVEKYGHRSMPTPGSPTHCYRCGGLEDVFMEPGTTPITHRICTRCLPERAARYRQGDFEAPLKQPAAEKTA